MGTRHVGRVDRVVPVHFADDIRWRRLTGSVVNGRGVICIATQIQKFQVHMPQMVVAFVPLVCLWPTLLVTANHGGAPGLKWVLIACGLFCTIFAAVAMIVVGLRTYSFLIHDSGIGVGKTRFSASEIQVIRVRKTMVDIKTRSWKKQSSVAFNKADLALAVDAISRFADDHGIRFESR